MGWMNKEQLIKKYKIYVESIGENGVETGDMLGIRSSIEYIRDKLTVDERSLVENCDDVLRRSIGTVKRELGFDPKSYREEKNIPKSHWWWYPDLIVDGEKVEEKKVLSEG
jgi:hypothetical protein